MIVKEGKIEIVLFNLPLTIASGTRFDRRYIKYDPPGGVIGSIVAKLFGEEPSQQIEEDFNRLKQVMEAGEVATTRPQPPGRSVGA